MQKADEVARQAIVFMRWRIGGDFPSLISAIQPCNEAQPSLQEQHNPLAACSPPTQVLSHAVTAADTAHADRKTSC